MLTDPGPADLLARLCSSKYYLGVFIISGVYIVLRVRYAFGPDLTLLCYGVNGLFYYRSSILITIL